MKQHHSTPTESVEATRNLFVELLPAWVKAGNRSLDGSHRGLVTVPKTKAPEFDQVQINTDIVRFICVDVDTPSDEWKESRTLTLPPGLTPLALVETPSGGFHIVFAVDFVKKENEGAASFLKDVRLSLNSFFSGDAGYTNWSMRNPLKVGAKVTWFAGAKVCTLSEFKSPLKSCSSWTPQKSKPFGSNTNTERDFTSENNAIYEFVCETVSRYDVPRDAHFEDVLALALDVNAQFETPRDDEEVRATVRSGIRGGIARARWRENHKPEKAAALGADGGAVCSVAQYEARCDALDGIQQERAQVASERRTEALRLRAEGYSVSKIAKTLGVSRPTVYSDLKADETEFAPVARSYDPSTYKPRVKKIKVAPVIPQKPVQVVVPVPVPAEVEVVHRFACECEWNEDGHSCYTTDVPSWTACGESGSDSTHECPDIFEDLAPWSKCSPSRSGNAYKARWQEAWEHRCKVVREAHRRSLVVSPDVFDDLLPHISNPAVDQWGESHHARQHDKETLDECRTCKSQALRAGIEQVIMTAPKITVDFDEEAFAWMLGGVLVDA